MNHVAMGWRGRTKSAVLIFAVFIGALRLFLSAVALESPYVYQKDFIQEYLIGRAAHAGLNPYLPLSDLAARLMEPPPSGTFRHPTPHPPAVALLALPLAAFTYRQAAIVWFVVEISCLFIAVYLLFRTFESRPTVQTLAVAVVFALNWPPVFDELVTGQLMLLLLVLYACAWRSLRSGDSSRAGIWLGCILALKLMAWPILIFLLLRKSWSAVATACVVAGAANVAAAAVVGVGTVLNYYREIGPSVALLYRGNGSNFSLWSIAWRLFEGTGSDVGYSLAAPPLLAAPAVANIAASGAALALLALGLLLALKAEGLDAAFSILVCVNILIGPVAWSHYLVLTLIPIAAVLAPVFAATVPRSVARRIIMALAFSVLVFTLPLARIALLFATSTRVDRTLGTVPFAAGLITLAPALVIAGLMWTIWYVDRLSRPTLAGAAPLSGVGLD